VISGIAYPTAPPDKGYPIGFMRVGSEDVDMSNKPPSKDALKNRLSRLSEITITVTGRKSGRTISVPVWFVLEDGKLYLLPVNGSDTQWYKNVLKNPSIRIDAGGDAAELRAVPVTDPKQVASVVEKFRAKYGASDVKKYYSKFDVAVLSDL
jgi:deazaflavin-dependent oxidoreductase (nitroreductase family)